MVRAFERQSVRDGGRKRVPHAAHARIRRRSAGALDLMIAAHADALDPRDSDACFLVVSFV
jgi:hypothetical protein